MNEVEQVIEPKKGISPFSLALSKEGIVKKEEPTKADVKPPKEEPSPSEKEESKEDNFPKNSAGEKPKEEIKPDAEPYSPLRDSEPSEDKKSHDDSQKMNERLNAARSGFLKTSHKLSEALKLIDGLESEGGMTEAEAEKLKTILTHDVPDEVLFDKKESDSPLSKLFNAVNPEIEHMRKYVDDDQFNDYLISFNRWLMADGTQKDREEIFSLMEDFDDPAMQAKKVVAIGKKLYHDLYKQVKEAGGLSKLMSHYEKSLSTRDDEIKELKEKLDKLSKKNDSEKEYLHGGSYKIPFSKDPDLNSGGFKKKGRISPHQNVPSH